MKSDDELRGNIPVNKMIKSEARSKIGKKFSGDKRRYSGEQDADVAKKPLSFESNLRPS